MNIHARGLAFSIFGIGALGLVVGGFRNPPAAKLSDGFEDFDSDRWVPIRTGNLAEAWVGGGRLNVHLPAGMEGLQYAGLFGRNAHDFHGGSWEVRADVSDFLPGEGAEAKFRVTRDHDNNYVAFEVADGHLHFTRKFRGELGGHKIPFDHTRHRFWKIRHDEEADSIHWETSSDGRNWWVQHRERRGFSLRAVIPEIYAGAYQPGSSVRKVRFLSFNTSDAS